MVHTKCASCEKKLSLGDNRQKNKRIIPAKWLLVYFKTIGVNTSKHKFICSVCHQYLSDKNDSKHLYDER